jgi:hypothetical protein
MGEAAAAKPPIRVMPKELAKVVFKLLGLPLEDCDKAIIIIKASMPN